MRNEKQKTGDLGQHWTPHDTVDFMISLKQNDGTVLEPSAGCGRFLEKLPNALGLEFDETVITEGLNYQLGNFFDFPLSEKFDTIIGNPPYVAGKLLTDEWFSNWRGCSPRTANAYIHFIDKCLEHLNDGGELIFIVPDSLLGSTSYGKNLREKMMNTGSITHYFTPNTKWEKADVGTCIFRFEKDKQTDQVITEDGTKKITNINGFFWIVDYESDGVFADHFDITVGAVPKNTALNSEKENAQPFFKNGEFVMVDMDNTDSWPRYRITKETPKIFWQPGPTRKETLFWVGTTDKHLNPIMVPKKAMTIEELDKLASELNEWFAENDEAVGLKRQGRFTVGVNQLKSMPFPVLTNKKSQ